MYNQPYFIPTYMRTIAAPTMMRGLGTMGAPLMSTANTAGRGLGLIGRLGNGLSAFRSINWGGLINGASKTLGIVNQAIPLVRQVGPMVNNMKSMLRVASIFKDETDKGNQKNNTIHSQTTNHNNINMNNTYQSTNHQQSQNRNNNPPTTNIEKQEASHQEDSNSPTFFIPA